MKSILFLWLITLLYHFQNFWTPILNGKQNSLTGPVITGSFEKRAPGARFSKDPVTTGPVNLPGRLTGNFTGPGIAFLEAPVNFPDTYRAR